MDITDTTEPDAEYPRNTTTETYSNVFSVPSLNIVYFSRMRNAFRSKIREREDFQGRFKDARGSQSEQISALKEALESKIDFLMVVPIRAEAVAPIVDRAKEREIPFIAVDRNISGSVPTTHIASDNYQLGQRSMSLLTDKMRAQWDQDEYKVVELQGTQGASVTDERHTGGMTAVDESAIRVIDSEPTEFSVQEAVDVTEAMIEKHGEAIDGIYAHNDLMALGAHRAVTGTPLEGVPITGVDGSEAWVGLFNEHEQYGTIAQLPEKIVRTAIDAGIRAVQGESLDDTYRIEGIEVTADNATTYIDEYF